MTALTALAEPAREVQAPGDGTGILIMFSVLCGIGLVVGFVVASRRRGEGAMSLLVLALVGSAIAVFNEPIYDLLGKIYYPTNHPVAWVAFEREIPLFLYPGYLPFVAVLPFVLSRAMRDGIRRELIYAIAFASFVAVMAIEIVGTSTDNWVYYGDPPLKYLGVAPQMGAMPIVCAALLLWAGDRLRGPSRLLIALIPAVSLGAVYASAGWPIYVALYSDVPKAVEWLAGATTLVICATIVWAIADAVAPGRHGHGGRDAR